MLCLARVIVISYISLTLCDSIQTFAPCIILKINNTYLERSVEFGVLSNLLDETFLLVPGNLHLKLVLGPGEAVKAEVFLPLLSQPGATLHQHVVKQAPQTDRHKANVGRREHVDEAAG